MPTPLLIIVTGPPCSGKTTLGKRLAQELHLPFIHKDGIKERLFDTLGWSDRPWSKQLGLASFQVLSYFVEALLQVGCSFIVEANFDPAIGSSEYLALKAQYNFEPLQILCHTEGQTLFQRFMQRSESSERHPGHGDYLYYEEFKAGLLRGRLDPMEIGGTIVEVDTTDFARLNYAKLVEAVNAVKRNVDEV